ncbi:MAG: HU family DNA-binding protein [Paracoccaceae bacterium]
MFPHSLPVDHARESVARSTELDRHSATCYLSRKQIRNQRHERAVLNMVAKPPSTPARKTASRAKTGSTTARPKATRSSTRSAVRAKASTVKSAAAASDMAAPDADEALLAAAPKPAAPEAGPAPQFLTPAMRKRELIDAVVTRSGIKKKDAKPVVEAMLAVLGETLAEGREINLLPLGKGKINRAHETANGRVIVLRLRQKTPAEKPEKDPLAEPAE